MIEGDKIVLVHVSEYTSLVQARKSPVYRLNTAGALIFIICLFLIPLAEKESKII